MPNVNRPFGFQLFRAEGKENRVKFYRKASGSAIFPGDVVQLLAAGTVGPAAASGAILGVACEYKTAADTTDIAVIDDPEAEFIVQVNGGTFALADVGQNAVIDISTAGEVSPPRSRQMLNATFATTAAHQWKILGLAPVAENEVGASAIVRVKPNEHVFKAGTTGI
jgi:hypothetical protein